MSKFEDIWGNIDGEDSDNGYEDDRSEYGDDDRDEGEYKTTFEQEKSATGKKNIAAECAGTIELPNKNDKDFRRMKALLTPEDNFKYDVDKISQYLNENEDLDLNVNERNDMCRMSSLITNVNFFNAPTFVIAYWVTNGGREIDKKKWKQIYKNNKTLININFGVDYEKKANTYPADVVRYARYIIKINNI